MRLSELVGDPVELKVIDRERSGVVVPVLVGLGDHVGVAVKERVGVTECDLLADLSSVGVGVRVGLTDAEGVLVPFRTHAGNCLSHATSRTTEDSS